jgi:hypothetical protein
MPSIRIFLAAQARKLAERDSIEEGLVCVFSILEPCRTFSIRFQPGRPYVQSAQRKCLHLYHYFMDRRFGLIHMRIQTWFPLQIQVYLNGHEWLARKLTAHQVRYSKIDNVFVQIEDLDRAQRLADRFANLNWPTILNQYAIRVAPQLHDLLKDCQRCERAKRILDRHPVQDAPGSVRAVPTTS